MSSCKSSPTDRLSFGLFSKDTTALNRLKSLTYEGLTSKVEDTKESMLVVTYKGEGCSCWPTFQAQAKLYNEEYHGWFYIIKASEFTGKTNTFDMRIPEGDTVSLSIFSKGKLVKQWVDNDDNKKIFQDYKEMRNAISAVIGDPTYLYADESGLDYLIANKTKLSVYFAKTDCPDCTSLETTLLAPYASAHTIVDDFYIFDVATFKGTERYQEIKDKYGLSTKNNTTLGFGDGVMPTLQYIENKAIKDMAVIYNDTVTKADGKYTVTDSYYDENRYTKLSFMSKVTTKVLKGLELTKDDVSEVEYPGYGTYVSWLHDKANTYYKPIFDAFMDSYCLKK